jgi:hypothetical protein
VVLLLLPESFLNLFFSFSKFKQAHDMEEVWVYEYMDNVLRNLDVKIYFFIIFSRVDAAAPLLLTFYN